MSDTIGAPVAAASVIPVEPHTSPIALQVGEILATRRRLWLRGKVLREVNAEESSWFFRWWRGRAAASLPPTGQLEIRLASQEIRAEVELNPEGCFEALVTADLPICRRGWAVSRQRLTLDDQTAEGCGAVLFTPEQARRGAVVLLPLSSTGSADGPEQLRQCALAGRVNSLLHQLQRQADGPLPVYYLGVAPTAADAGPQHIALALTSLGWPTGSVILLPASVNTPQEALTRGLDRLRWLLANTLTLTVINMEASLASTVATEVMPREDRARVEHLIHPGSDPEMAAATGQEIVCTNTLTLRPTRSARLTRYPVVFCHGMLALSTLRMSLPNNLNSFIALEPFLKQRGFRALFPQVPPTAGVAERASKLREQIVRWTAEPVNLIAHSMGGLDARHMITHLGMADHVRSLTTICTPHRGTFLAEWFNRNYRRRVPLLLGLELLGINLDGFRDCQRAACKAFNASTPNMPGVQYFSYGGDVPSWRVTPVLRRAWNLLTPVEGPNDGMVSVASARWGEYLGTIPADHLAQTPDSLFIHPAETFDPLNFYLDLVDDLARREL